MTAIWGWLNPAWKLLTSPIGTIVLLIIGFGILIYLVLKPERETQSQLISFSETQLTESEKKYADWMTAAHNRDIENLQNTIYLRPPYTDFKHLVDPDSYFEIHYQMRSGSVFTIDIGKEIDGRIRYDGVEFGDKPEVIKPVIGLVRNGHDELVLRQKVSDAMMQEIMRIRMREKEGDEHTLHLGDVKIMVSAIYPDGSEGPKCNLNIPSKIKGAIPTEFELMNQ